MSGKSAKPWLRKLRRWQRLTGCTDEHLAPSEHAAASGAPRYFWGRTLEEAQRKAARDRGPAARLLAVLLAALTASACTPPPIGSEDEGSDEVTTDATGNGDGDGDGDGDGEPWSCAPGELGSPCVDEATCDGELECASVVGAEGMTLSACGEMSGVDGGCPMGEVQLAGVCVALCGEAKDCPQEDMACEGGACLWDNVECEPPATPYGACDDGACPEPEACVDFAGEGTMCAPTPGSAGCEDPELPGGYVALAFDGWCVPLCFFDSDCWPGQECLNIDSATVGGQSISGELMGYTGCAWTE